MGQLESYSLHDAYSISILSGILSSYFVEEIEITVESVVPYIYSTNLLPSKKRRKIVTAKLPSGDAIGAMHVSYDFLGLSTAKFIAIEKPINDIVMWHDPFFRMPPEESSDDDSSDYDDSSESELSDYGDFDDGLADDDLAGYEGYSDHNGLYINASGEGDYDSSDDSSDSSSGDYFDISSEGLSDFEDYLDDSSDESTDDSDVHSLEEEIASSNSRKT
jgi:hypothetical protein